MLRGLFTLEALIAAAFVATICAFAFEESLTSRHMKIGPDGAGKSFDSYWYADESNGGSSQALQDGERQLSWICNLTRTYEYGYCGFGLLLDRQHVGRGLDLSQFDSLALKLNYDGPGSLVRVALKNHDRRYPLPDGSVVAKVNQASSGVRQGQQVIRLALPDFHVPEWWMEETRAPPSASRPEFDNVVALELLTGADSVAGEHRIAVEEISFSGRIIPPALWYSLIGICWILLGGALLLRRRRNRDRRRRRVAQGWRTTLDAIPQMVWCYHGRGSYYNGRWQEFTGVPVGRRRTDPFALIHRDDRRGAVEALRDSLANGSALNTEMRLKHRSGDYRWVLAQGGPARDEGGEIVGWYGTCTDVHDRVLAESALKDSVKSARQKSWQLKWLSEHDPLTGLPNRRAFQERLQAACAIAGRACGHFALLLIDLDHFKHVNDTLGHQAGDDLLKLIGDRLRSSVRQNDFVARIGGDEFAVIVEKVGDPAEVLAIAEELLNQLRAPVEVEGRMLSSAASIGGARFPSDAGNSEDLFKAADTALYALKTAGRGGTRMFQKEMMANAERAASQLRLARLAVREDSVVPFYQPKVDLRTGALVGFEALLRWKGRDADLQLPGGLAEAFKDYELAAKIGEIMQRKVAGDVQSWSARGLPFGRVSINASPAEFLRDDYAEHLHKVLSDHGVSGECIEIEVTEHVLLECGSPFVRRALNDLKSAGIAVSLDDFGTGYSSLSHLRDFPVDSVKVDQSFIQQMVENHEIASIVAAVVALAQNLGVRVVAEGVEDKGQLDLLNLFGCDVGQGHYFGRPVDAAATERLLRTRIAA